MGFSRPEHWWHSGGRGRLTCSWIVPVLLAIGTSLLINTGPAMALTLTSSAFEPGGAISWKYTCEGDNVLPPLACPRPEGPQTRLGALARLQSSAGHQSLAENASGAGLPGGATAGLSDFKQTVYRGPCPPIGRHRYFHKLYALDIALPAKPLTKPELEAAMKGHVLAQAELIGTYQKGDR